jgi:hypothetical protein
VRKHLAQLTPNQYEELVSFIPNGPLAHDMTFWSKSDGVSGLFARLRASYHYLGIVQGYAAEGYISREDAMYLWWRIAAQAVLTIIAIPEAAFCHIFSIRHMAARQSVQFYCEIVMRTNTLVDSMCPINTPELL